MGSEGIKGKRGMKGYLLSLMVVFMFYSLLMFTYQAVSIKKQNRDVVLKDFYAEKVAYTVDDIASDIRALLSLDTPANSTQWTFIENMSVNRNVFFGSYPAFLANYSNVSNVQILMSYSNQLNITFSNGLVLVSNLSRNQTDFYNLTGGAPGVNRYEIILTTNEPRGGLDTPNYVANSSLYIRVNYTDPLHKKESFIESGYVNPNILNTMKIDFGPGKHIFLYFGLINGRPGSYRMQQVAIDTAVMHTLIVNRTTKDAVYAYYNLPVNVTTIDTSFNGLLPAN
jgi:hypothetical protein